MSQQLSLAQKFYLLQQKNHEANSSSFIMPTNLEMYIFIAILLELRILNIISVTNSNKITLQESSSTKVNYLNSTIEFIKNNDNLNIYDLIFRYLYNQFNVAKLQVEESLSSFKNSTSLFNIVESLRAEILEPGEVSDTNKALILLLDTSNYDVKLSKKFFSQYEQTTLQDKLVEIKNTQTSLTNDLVFISSKLQSGFKDSFYSLVSSYKPSNLRLINFKQLNAKNMANNNLDWWVNDNPKSVLGIFELVFSLLLSGGMIYVIISSVLAGVTDYRVYVTSVSLALAFLLSSGIVQLLFKIKTGSLYFKKIKQATIAMYFIALITVIFIFWPF